MGGRWPGRVTVSGAQDGGGRVEGDGGSEAGH